MSDSEVAVIVGAGQGLSASLARMLAGHGAQVVLAARGAGGEVLNYRALGRPGAIMLGYGYYRVP